MKLERISRGAGLFSFSCRGCGSIEASDKGWADLDGQPFKDYYCEKCKERLEFVEMNKPRGS